jgi:hypothetical protein
LEGLLFIVYATLFALLIMRWRFFRVSGIPRRYILLVYTLKLCCGFALAFLYSDHYTDRATGDTYRFFDDAKIIYDAREEGWDVYFKLLTGMGIEEDERALNRYYEMTHMERTYPVGFFNDNKTIIRANALVMLFSGGYYFVHIAFWCMASLIGLTAILKVLSRYFPRKRAAMFTSVYLLPTVLFWGSGVLKESILILGLGLFFRGIARLTYGEFKAKNSIGLLIGTALLILTKGYVFYALIPATAGLILAKTFSGQNFVAMFSIPHALMVALVFSGGAIHPELDIPEKLRLKQEAFYNVAADAGSGSTIELPPIEKPADVILNAPSALTVAYFRPWPWEWDKPIYVPAALENLLLILVILAMIWNFRRPYGLGIPLIAFALSFSVTLGILIGEVVPVLGAVVRYKLPALIFLFVLNFALTDHILFQRRFPFVRKLLRKL